MVSILLKPIYEQRRQSYDLNTFKAHLRTWGELFFCRRLFIEILKQLSIKSQKAIRWETTPSRDGGGGGSLPLFTNFPLADIGYTANKDCYSVVQVSSRPFLSYPKRSYFDLSIGTESKPKNNRYKCYGAHFLQIFPYNIDIVDSISIYIVQILQSIDRKK